MLGRLAGFIALCLGLVAANSAFARVDKRLPADQAEIMLSFAPLVKRAAPAVVNIYTRRVVEEVVRSPLFDDPFFRRFFGEGFGFGGPRIRRQQNSLGSGVIVSPSGLIVTNHHVVKGADEITVALSDRREFEARLVLDDERTDLAILRVDGEVADLPYLDLGDSDALEVGDLVLAIGNPFNVGQTVTSGIVSALARTGVGVSDLQSFIQTDAAINPGNSGGALITMEGEVAGINTAIFSRSGGSHGIGFAVPANMARVVLESARKGLDYVQRPWLGAATQPMSGEIAVSMGLDRPVGALVRAIYPDGPADKAGIRVGDVIVAAGGREVDDPESLSYRLGTRLIAGTLELTLLRAGKAASARVQLLGAPEEPPREITEIDGRVPLAGAIVANLSPALAEELGVDTLLRGVIVLSIKRRSPAHRLKLQPGDRIMRVNGVAVADVRTLNKVLDAPQDDWRLTIQRGDRTLSVVVRA